MDLVKAESETVVLRLSTTKFQRNTADKSNRLSFAGSFHRFAVPLPLGGRLFASHTIGSLSEGGWGEWGANRITGCRGASPYKGIQNPFRPYKGLAVGVRTYGISSVTGKYLPVFGKF